MRHTLTTDDTPRLRQLLKLHQFRQNTPNSVFSADPATARAAAIETALLLIEIDTYRSARRPATLLTSIGF